MKKNNNKGFTLVELIVVLVILAILAAILIPALLGYIDRAREKQVTTNAEAALVAAQGKMADAYGALEAPSKHVTKQKIKDLTEITESFTAYYTAASFKTSSKVRSATASARKPIYKITKFAYYSPKAGQTAVCEDGEWNIKPGDVAKTNAKYEIK